MANLQLKKLIVVILLLIAVCIILFSVDSMKEAVIDKNSWSKTSSSYDIIVVGGDPEGISAAVCAAKSGAKVLLVSYEDGLGGLMTYGMLNTIDMNRNSQKKMVTSGIFMEFYKKVGGDSFDISKAQNVFKDMIRSQKNITYIPKIKFISPVMDKNKITGISIEKDNNKIKLSARIIIDATQDADIAASAGVPFTLGQEDVGLKNTYMCSTLVFKVKNVDWEQLAKDIKKNKREESEYHGINKSSAWGFGDIGKEYKPLHENMKIRGLNMGRQDDGSIMINTLQIIGVDLFDEKSRDKAIEKGKDEAKNITAFLRKRIPAFSKAEFAGTASQLYIRETRHIIGEYILKVSDVLENRNFEDKIAVVSYPIDIQPVSIKDPGIIVGNPDQYSIPLRCLVPLKVENMFVVGRSASYSSVAAGSARVIPAGMVTGQAAGAASAYCIKNGLTPREAALDKKVVKGIQEKLIKQGAYLPEFSAPNKNSSLWVYPDLKKLSEIGVVRGGYDNDYKVYEPILKKDFGKTIRKVLERTLPEKLNKDMEEKILGMCPGEYINKDIAAQVLLYIMDEKIYDKGSAFNMAKRKGILSPEFLSRVKGDNNILTGEAFNLCVYFAEKISGRKLGI